MRERSIENRHAGHAEMKRLFIASMVALLIVGGYGVARPHANDAHHPKTSKAKKAVKAKQTRKPAKKSGGPTQDGLEGTRDQSAASFAFNPVHWRTQGA
jgi:hypothetical protein